ncbi:EF-hand domain-containing protein [Longispora albida]|uniref:EF-hand domain-containing protein n=1 Tax=Longispora albida TaxID=203523 RepID=UPI00039E1339|nr:EF-hand domain-containing protein [Longispora albida]
MTGERSGERVALRFAMLDRGSKGYLDGTDFEALGQRISEAFGIEPDSPKGKAMAHGGAMYWGGLAEHGLVTREVYVTCVHSPEWYEEHMLPSAEAVGAAADPDDDGYIERADFAKLLGAIGFADTPSLELFDRLDTAGAGRITVGDWVTVNRAFYTGTADPFIGNVLL